MLASETVTDAKEEASAAASPTRRAHAVTASLVGRVSALSFEDWTSAGVLAMASHVVEIPSPETGGRGVVCDKADT